MPKYVMIGVRLFCRPTSLRKAIHLNKKIITFVTGALLALTWTLGLVSPAMAATVVPLTEEGLTPEQQAVREVALAYYWNGPSQQYDVFRSSQYEAPEEATSQNMQFLICTSFVYGVYENALGIQLFANTSNANAYGRQFYGVSGFPDIPLYYPPEELCPRLAEDSTREAFKEELLPQLEVGDALNFYRLPDGGRAGGHECLIIDFIYDEQGNRTDAVALHSTSSSDKEITKISNGLNWYDKVNKETGLAEGTVKMGTLSALLYRQRTSDYMTVLRPLALGDGTYHHVEQAGTSFADFTNFVTKEPYALTESARARIAWTGLEIEKTVDVFDGSNVQPGQELTYTVELTNHGESNFFGLLVRENVPKWTTLVSGDYQETTGGEVIWLLDLASGETVSLNYTVQVDDDPALMGWEITETGSAGGIATGTVTNAVYPALNESQKAALKAAYQSLSASYSGADLINQVYQKALDMDLGLDSLTLGVRYNHESNTDQVREINRTCVPYFSETPVDALISTWYRPWYYCIELNRENDFADMILNHYYSAAFTSYTRPDPGAKTRTQIYRYEGKINLPDTRTDRNDYIYPETLQTGDILVYLNANDPVYNEDGQYTFMYIDDAFYGVNALADGSPQNIVYGSNEPHQLNTLATLFGKDFYVILRPIMGTVERVTPPEPAIQSETVLLPGSVSENEAESLIPVEEEEPQVQDSLITFLVFGGSFILLGIACASVMKRREKAQEKEKNKKNGSRKA